MYMPRDMIEQYRGIYQTNAAGETLEEFLENYDPKKWDNPSATVDTVVFAEEGGALKKVMMIRRGNHPSIGMWGVPGGFVEYKENLKDAALRELAEETGIDGIDAVQLKTYGDWDRDPRTRIITTVFATVVKKDDITFAAGDDAAEADWFDIDLKEDENGDLILTLTADSSDTRLSSVIRVEKNTVCGIEEKKYKVISRDGIAVDHGVLITESMLIMKDKMKGI